MKTHGSTRIDLGDRRANMFGVLPCPCPQCGGKHRWPTRPDHPSHPNMVLCDECETAQTIDATGGEGEEAVQTLS